ncbi:MAG: diguanylate cyclase [Pseudomonadota bacterium]
MPEKREKPTVILASQSPQKTKLIGRHLQEYFSLLAADDSEQAWELLLDNRDVSLMICELSLTSDSFGLLERIRDAKDNRLAATPVLLLVGEQDSEKSREEAFRNGATDFINLPFASSELIARVRLHAHLYVQHSVEPTVEMQQISAVNVLQQLSQENFFNSRAQQEISFSQRHRSSVSLCKLKLDNIKAIMSGFDKSTAVSVVQAVARIIQDTLRREDSLCYFGNAVFCILYPATNGIGATTGINRILKNIAERKIRIAGKQVPVSMSGSVHSCIANDETTLEGMYKVLEQNLDRAIAEGGNKIVSSLPPDEEKTLSVDRALKLIDSGKTQGLTEQAADLLGRVLPLIEYADSELALDLGPLLAQIEDGLNLDSEEAVKISVSN